MVIFHSYVSSPVGILSIPIISSSYPHDIPMMFPHFFLNSSQKLTACNAQCRRTGASTQRFRRGPTHQGALRVWHLSIQVENRTSMEGAWSFKTIYSTWKNFSQQQFHCNKIMFFCWVLEVFGLKMIQNAQFRTTIDAQQDQSSSSDKGDRQRFTQGGAPSYKWVIIPLTKLP